MIVVKQYSDIVTDKLLKGNIDNDEFEGFLQDYRVLHCLLRKYQPKSVFEIGTNMGVGTNIICNAIPTAEVYSLDLPTELAHISLQHPINEGKGDKVGSRCNYPYIQLRGDSQTFDFSQFKCEAFYVDGEHIFKNVLYESKELLKLNPKLIIYHDTDMPDVFKAIAEAMIEYYDTYFLIKVAGTRISYIIKKDVLLS